MLCRYINGASVLGVSRCSLNSTPRRWSHVGRLHGANGTAYPIFGSLSSPGGLEFGDGHWSDRSYIAFRPTIFRWNSSQILPLVVLAGLNDILGDPFSQARWGLSSIVPSHSTDRIVKYATGSRNSRR